MSHPHAPTPSTQENRSAARAASRVAVHVIGRDRVAVWVRCCSPLAAWPRYIGPRCGRPVQRVDRDQARGSRCVKVPRGARARSRRRGALVPPEDDASRWQLGDVVDRSRVEAERVAWHASTATRVTSERVSRAAHRRTDQAVEGGTPCVARGCQVAHHSGQMYRRSVIVLCHGRYLGTDIARPLQEPQHANSLLPVHARWQVPALEPVENSSGLDTKMRGTQPVRCLVVRIQIFHG